MSSDVGDQCTGWQDEQRQTGYQWGSGRFAGAAMAAGGREELNQLATGTALMCFFEGSLNLSAQCVEGDLRTKSHPPLLTRDPAC